MNISNLMIVPFNKPQSKPINKAFNKKFNKQQNIKKKLKETTINHLYIATKNKSVIEIDDNLNIINNLLTYDISKINNITLMTNQGKYLYYIINDELKIFNLHLNKHYNIEYLKLDKNLKSKFSSIIKDNYNIISLAIINTMLLFIINTNDYVYIVKTDLTYNVDTIQINNFVILKQINKSYIKLIHKIDFNIVDVIYYNNKLYLLCYNDTKCGLTSSERRCDIHLFTINWYASYSTLAYSIIKTNFVITNTNTPICFNFKNNKLGIIFINNNIHSINWYNYLCD